MKHSYEYHACQKSNSIFGCSYFLKHFPLKRTVENILIKGLTQMEIVKIFHDLIQVFISERATHQHQMMKVNNQKRIIKLLIYHFSPFRFSIKVHNFFLIPCACHSIKSSCDNLICCHSLCVCLSLIVIFASLLLFFTVESFAGSFRMYLNFKNWRKNFVIHISRELH